MAGQDGASQAWPGEWAGMGPSWDKPTLHFESAKQAHEFRLKELKGLKNHLSGGLYFHWFEMPVKAMETLP